MKAAIDPDENQKSGIRVIKSLRRPLEDYKSQLLTVENLNQVMDLETLAAVVVVVEVVRYR